MSNTFSQRGGDFLGRDSLPLRPPSYGHAADSELQQSISLRLDCVRVLLGIGHKFQLVSSYL